MKPPKLAELATQFLAWLEVRHYTASSVSTKRERLEVFLRWASERELDDPEQINRIHLQSYQRHLHRYRKKNGRPLGVGTQINSLAVLKTFFSWLTKHHHVLANPASDLELPRKEKRLPAQVPSISEMENIFAIPDLGDPLGLRNRAILEIFYSTGIRRMELVNLQQEALHSERQTLQIRQGKGRKDRVVPLGERALHWLTRYLEESRPHLETGSGSRALFLSKHGQAFHPTALSYLITELIKQSGSKFKGSCHLLRHTCATHMLEGGADIRFIQQLLGHENLETTAIYTQVSIEQLRAVHSKTHPAEAPKKAQSKPPETDEKTFFP